MTAIKVCGIRTPEHALVATAAGADMIGMIFASQSTRTVTPEAAKLIVTAVRESAGPKHPLVVGVFVNEHPGRMNELAEFCDLDLLQLSGDESWDMVEQLERPTIKALRVPAGRSAGEVVDELTREWPALNARRGRYLIEPHVTGQYGGTGQRIDWSLAAAVAAQFPILLSGGLAPDNVAEATRIVHPWGVDVSSGIETGGTKDSAKIRAFIAAARSTEAELITSGEP